MTKIDIFNTEPKHLFNLYKHLSVQSLLDIKAVNGEVKVDILLNMLNASAVSRTVYFGDKLGYTVFVMPTDEEEESVFLLSTTKGYSEIESLEKTFAAIVRDLPNHNFYSLVYKGNHKYAKLLKDNGFVYLKSIIHGTENKTFLLLRRNKFE